MRTGILGSVGALLAAAPLSLADPPPARPAAPPPPLSADLSADALALPGQLPPPAGAAAPAQPAPQPELIPPPASSAPPAQPAQPATQPQPVQQQAPCAQPPERPAWHDCHVGPPEQLWLGGGYRAWWMKNQPVSAALVTTGPVAGGGIPGSPGTVVLSGGQPVDFGTFNGFDVYGGMWLDCRHTVGLELGGFYFGQQSVTDAFASDAAGNPFIARPIIEALTVAPVGVIVSSPGTVAGSVNVDWRSRFAGAEANVVKNLMHCENYTVDSFFGFRYLDLEEDLDITQVSRPLGGGTLSFGGAPLPPGAGVALLDQFRTRNQFYGGSVGSRAELRFGPVFIDFTNSVAIGPVHEVIEIGGRTQALTPGGGILPGGLLAVGSGVETVVGPFNNPTAFVRQGNLGRYVADRIAYVPEVGLQVGAYVTQHVKVMVGYDFLYISDVSRPGFQVNPVINGRFVPTSPAFGSTSGPPAAPFYPGGHDDFYAHGVRFGVEVRY